MGILAIAPTSMAAAATAPSFGAATNFGLSGGLRPTSAVLADVNNDGKLDAVSSNRTTDDMAVLLGTGTGSLGTAVRFGLNGGDLPLSAAVADLNHDGKRDAVIANGTSNNVSVLLGDGAGNFGTATNLGLGGGEFPFQVAIGDVNGDTHPDLATANSNTDNVSVLLGNGSGGFGAATNYGLNGGDTPQSVALADVSGDGKPDLVTANRVTSTASVLLGNGAGGFGTATSVSVGSSPVSVAIGDLNGDAKPDLVTANGNATVSVALGNGSGGFAAAATHGAGTLPTSVVIGDVNGDTEPDLVVSNDTADTVSVLAGDGAGGFAAAADFDLNGASGPNSVAIGDLNADGRPDLATANILTHDVSVLLNNLAPSCDGSTATIVGTPGDDVLVGTSGANVINGLGGNDVIVGGGGNDVVCGGAGDDIIVGGAGADRVFGQAGNDVITGGSGADVLVGGWGNDIVSGEADPDALDGAAGTDVCDGGSSTDTAANCEAVSNVP